MELKQQVCSLELARRLKELGVKQESYFSWADWGNEGDCRVFHGDIRPAEPITRIAAAFTVAELGEMLPKLTNSFREPAGAKERWVCTRNEPSIMISQRNDTEADARAKMLVYLLENKLITL